MRGKRRPEPSVLVRPIPEWRLADTVRPIERVQCRVDFFQGVLDSVVLVWAWTFLQSCQKMLLLRKERGESGHGWLIDLHLYPESRSGYFRAHTH